MDTTESTRLQREWEAKGNPPCDHPVVEGERYLGADTGDEACKFCGASAHRGTLQESVRGIFHVDTKPMMLHTDKCPLERTDDWQGPVDTHVQAVVLAQQFGFTGSRLTDCSVCRPDR